MASDGYPAGAGSGALPALNIDFNAEGWGPSSENLPEKFAMLPFATFHRNEKIGKAADFGSYLSQRQRGQFRRGMDENVDLAGPLYEAGDSQFVTVDTAKAPKKQGFVKGRQQQRQMKPQMGGVRGNVGIRGWEDRQKEQMTGTSFNKRYNKLTRARWVQGNRMGPRTLRDASVRVASDWLQLEMVDLAQLMKATLPSESTKSAAPLPVATDLKWTGQLAGYDEDFDRITAKKPLKLKNFPHKQVKSVGAAGDPIFEELAGEGAGNVFATDSVLAHLMASTRSAYPWDIVINYIGGTIFLDAREPQEFDIHSVNETSHQPPEDTGVEDINGRGQLSIEATITHHDFKQQVLLPHSKPGTADKPNPSEPTLEPIGTAFFDPEEAEPGDEPAVAAYRYRKWNVGKDITLVARTSVHAVHRKKTGSQYVTCYTLTEYDPKVAGTTEWKKNIDTQRGNVLATEMKNNSFKLAKFTAQTLLAGADVMKLGFVSRVSKTDTEAHQILGVQTLSPSTFAHQMSLEPHNMWGVLRWLVDLVRKHAANLRQGEAGEDGSGDAPDDSEYMAKFVLMRDPNFPRVYLYNVPLEAFDREEEAEEGGDWAEGGDEGAAGGASNAAGAADDGEDA